MLGKFKQAYDSRKMTSETILMDFRRELFLRFPLIPTVTGSDKLIEVDYSKIAEDHPEVLQLKAAGSKAGPILSFLMLRNKIFYCYNQDGKFYITTQKKNLSEKIHFEC